MTTAIDIFINMMYDYWYTSFFLLFMHYQLVNIVYFQCLVMLPVNINELDI